MKVISAKNNLMTKLAAKGQCEVYVIDAIKEFISDTEDDWNYITPEELNGCDLSDFYIVDLRKPEDYAKGHIEGAKNIFWMDILDDSNLKSLPKDKKILLVCYVGHTSSQVLVLLRLLGYDVVSLKFGMGVSPDSSISIAGWNDYDYKIVKGKDE